MPWSNQGGGGPWGGGGNGSGGPGRGGGNSPWGKGPGGFGGGGGGGGGSGPTPPDIDEIIRKGQEKLKGFMPGGSAGKFFVAAIVLVGLGLWLVNGFYRVQPNQQGVELVLGKWNGGISTPGLHWNWPSPIGTVFKPNVTQENRIEVGVRSGGSEINRRSTGGRDVPEESQMITGDENIVDIDFVVFWKISDAPEYLFNLQNPDETVKMAAESVMRDMVGKTPIQSALTVGKEEIETQAQIELQRLINEYGAGIEIRQVQLLDVLPPKNVIDAFDEVTRARQDMERIRNEAEAYRNDVVPRARGEASKLIQGAEAYRQEVVNRAQGDANRFNSVFEAYRVSKDVTTQRIYLETLEEVLRNVNKVIIDDNGDGAGGGGVVPYLPLPEIQKRSQN